MPRTLRSAALGALALAVLASCGRPPDEETQDNTPAASSSPGSTAVASTIPGSTTADTAVTPPTSAGEPTTTVEKPTVEIPEEIPTELVITDIEEGDGPAAAEGDKVKVRYVGVRSEDGTEFDSNFAGGELFEVTLGAGGVIPGWDQGLIGIKHGGRRQLDIPADLAYGDEGAGEIIKPGDALSFVIDAVVVIPETDPADAPKVPIEGAENVTELTITDDRVGEGEEIEVGQTAVMHLIALRADTGEVLISTWEGGAPEEIPYIEEQMLGGLFEGLEGMKVGGRRVVTIPFEQSFGAAGNEQLGLPAEVDLVVIIDLIAVY
jgi:peptidylprolyl isomerase